MRHKPEDLVKAIDRHAPREWRRAKFPEPRILVLPELESFALSSSAFAMWSLWNEAWTDPAVGFPILAHADVRTFILKNQDMARGVIHFDGHMFAIQIVSMVGGGRVPDHLASLVRQITRGTDDLFQDAELFWKDDTVRLRFLTD